MQSYWDNHPKNFLPYENIGAVFELTIREWLLAQGVRATNKEIFEAHKLFLKKWPKIKSGIPLLDIWRIDCSLRISVLGNR